MSSAASRNLPVTRLPDDLSLQVFSCLTPAELGRCCEVNSEWDRLASDNRVWGKLGGKRFGEDLNVPNFKDFYREFYLQQVRGNDGIVARIQDFANRVPLGCNGRLRVICPGDRGHQGDCMINYLTPSSLSL